jgi:class 3 adenylate cyclase
MKVVGLNRRLAAILFTDMVGYSALTEGDETLALELLEEHRTIIRNRVAEFGGREIKSTGDGFLIEFGAVIDSVQCAIQIQTALFERNLTVPDERQVRIRIGIHLGDIVDTDRDVHGNGINIAARIEPFAAPGSIAISQQVLDQVRDRVNLPLKKMGRLALKNIESPPEVYRFLLPWESMEPARFLASSVKSIRGWISALRSPTHASLAVAILGALIVGGILVKALKPTNGTEPERTETTSLLPKHWEIALGTQVERGALWRPFDPSHAEEFIDEVNGPYLLRLKFPAEKKFEHPAIVLGLVAQKHEAYLNGHFIGGSKTFADLVSYNVGTELSTEHENEIVIKAESLPSLSPGLYVVPGISPQIGDFDSISSLVDVKHFKSQVVQTVYLAVCLLTSVATMLYAIFRRRRKHFYSALFLASGAIGVSFYNSFAIQNLDFQVYRLLNLLSYLGAILALISFDFEARGQRKFETRNNLFGLAFGVVAILALGVGSVRPSVYLFRLEVLFGCVALYGAFALRIFFLNAARRRRSDTFLVRMFGILLAGISASIFLQKAPSVLGWTLPLLSQIQYDFVRQVGIVYPIAFALLIFGLSIVDYIRKTHEFYYKQKKDSLILGLANVIAKSENFPETVKLVQSRVADFLNASRSTIYLLDPSGKTLQAGYLHGSETVKSAVESTIDAEAGILGYCLKTQAPVWVEDIGSDERFRSSFQARADEVGAPRTYRTGSFIVAPIQIGRNVFGVITIADRKDGRAFTAEDFSLFYLASKDLSVLVSQLTSTVSKTLKLVA